MDWKAPSVQAVLEGFPRLEFRLFRCRNGDLLAGTGIAAFAGRALGHGEGAKSDQANFITLFQRVGNSFKHRINRLGCVSFRQTRSIGDMRHEIVLVHLIPLPNSTKKRRTKPPHDFARAKDKHSNAHPSIADGRALRSNVAFLRGKDRATRTSDEEPHRSHRSAASPRQVRRSPVQSTRWAQAREPGRASTHRPPC